MNEKIMSFVAGILLGVVLCVGYYAFFKSIGYGGEFGSRRGGIEFNRERGNFGSGTTFGSGSQRNFNR